MKPVPRSLTAAVFSMENAGHFADEDLLPPNSLVIVIQDGSRHTTSLLPVQCNYMRDYRLKIEALFAIPCNAEKAYGARPPLAARTSIDVVA
ncbi:MAG: hypothetical protein M3O30_19240 [Planctomycetota bacterium]|nr:hypothetical protein [Planctomycetota bacterium]